jgi:hypothetical protein
MWRAKNKSDEVFYYFLWALIGFLIFLASGLRNPFIGGIFYWLFVHFQPLHLFRQLFHFVFLITSFFFFTLVISINSIKNKNLVFKILIIAVFLYIVALLNGGNFSDKMAYWTASDMKQNASMYDFLCSKYNTGNYNLLIPFYPSTVDKRVNNAIYQKVGGADPLIGDSCFPTIGNDLPINYPYSQILSVFNTKKSNKEIFSNLGIEYIIYRKNFKSAYEYGYNSQKLMSRIVNDNKFKLEYSDYDFAIYRNLYNKGIVSGISKSFLRVSPVKFFIDVNKSKQIGELDFYELYNKGWKLFIDKDEKCTDAKLICSIKNISKEISYFFKSSVFDSSHLMLDKYANKWTINTDKIPVGSHLVLYYAPQEYFYIGGFVSILTVVLFSLGIVFFKIIRKFYGIFHDTIK